MNETICDETVAKLKKKKTATVPHRTEKIKVEWPRIIGKTKRFHMELTFMNIY